MAFGIGGLAGLYKGYQDAESESASTDLKKGQKSLQDFQIQGAGEDQAASVAIGNMLRAFSGQGPGGPQPPQPGQPSMPAGGPPGGGGMPPGPGGGPPPGPGPMPGGPMMSPQPVAQQGPPMQGGGMMPPGGGGPPPGGPPPGPGGPQGGGQAPPQLALQSIIQNLSRTNPGAPPGVLAKAIDRLMPMMNAQSQQEWKQLQMQLQQSGQLENERHHRAMEGTAEKRAENAGAGGGLGGSKAVKNQWIAREIAKDPQADILELSKRYDKETASAKREGQGPSATETRVEGVRKRYNTVLSTIDDALAQIKEGGWLTGLGGRATRISEVIKNFTNTGDETRANEFMQKLEIVKTMAPGLLTGRTITNKDERARIDKIVAGLSAGDTKQITTADLIYLSKTMKRLMPDSVKKGGDAAPKVDVDAATQKALDAGYTQEEIDAYKKKNKL